MIKTICFDLDGVYFTPRGMQEFAKSLGRMCKDEEKARHAVFASDKMMSFKRGKIPENEYWDWVNQELGINLSLKEYKNLLGKKYEVNKDVEETVKSVREKGYKTCICSNNFPTRINILQEKFGFLDNFDTVVLSFKVGVLKPDRIIFQELVDQAGVAPNEIFYSDDAEEKLAGANELGIKTAVYTTFNDFVQILGELGVKIN